MAYVPFPQRSAEEKARLGAQQAPADSPYYAEVRFSQTHSYMVLCRREDSGHVREFSTLSFWAQDQSEISRDLALYGSTAIGTSAAAAIGSAAVDNPGLTLLAEVVVAGSFGGLALAMLAKRYNGDWHEPHLDERYVGVGIPLTPEQFVTLEMDAEYLKNNTPAYNPADSITLWRNIPNAQNLGGSNCLGIVSRLLETTIGTSLQDRLGVGLPGKLNPLVYSIHGHIAQQAKALAAGVEIPDRAGLKYFTYDERGRRQQVNVPELKGG